MKTNFCVECTPESGGVIRVYFEFDKGFCKRTYTTGEGNQSESNVREAWNHAYEFLTTAGFLVEKMY